MDTDLLHDPRIACHVLDIAEGRLDPAAAIEFVSDDAHGGIDVFIGRVRASSHGRQCVAIHYDMFAPLALNVFRDTATAAVERFSPKAKCYVAHARGKLAVGDLAVVIAFGTPHRDEAFRGCREVIEAVKRVAQTDFAVEMGPRRPGDPASIVAKSDRARAVLNWRPSYDDLDVIVAHALRWEKGLG